MEKMVRDKLLEHLKCNNLSKTEQHRFRKWRSFGTQLLECNADWTIAVDNNKELDILY